MKATSTAIATTPTTTRTASASRTIMVDQRPRTRTNFASVDRRRRALDDLDRTAGDRGQPAGDRDVVVGGLDPDRIAEGGRRADLAGGGQACQTGDGDVAVAQLELAALLLDVVANVRGVVRATPGVGGPLLHRGGQLDPARN